MKKLYFGLLIIIASYAYSQQPHKVSVQSCLKPFYHGVASGDPLSDRVIIWTRVTPDTNQINQTIVVNWRMATDTGMTSIVSSGAVLTDSSADFTVKVDVTALNPNTVYYYEFQTGTYLSARGRTKTNPIGTNVDSLRFALVSCANYEAGWFNVYASLLQRQDFDAVISLGDYIYEYNTGGYSPNAAVNRQWSPANEIVSVADYRMRYSTYRLDNDLQRLHQQFPFIIVYDDHEFANDAWMNGAQNHTSGAEGAWSDRKAMAYKAFFEWQPIRQINTANPNQIYRPITYGNLVELMMLDTRIIGRDLQAGTSGATVTSPSRQLLGTTQYNWLANELSTTPCKWKILGQQVMMAPLSVFGIGFNGDQWDGYPAERDRIYNHVLSNNISNMVVITGDIHSSWANDLPTSTYNSSTGAGSAGVEFVTPSVTSPGLSIPGGASVIQAANGHIKYCDLSSHGYVIMDINQNRTQADWFNISTIDNQSPAYSHVKSFYVSNLQRFLKSTSSAALPRPSIYSTLAPLCPRTLAVTTLKEANNNPIVLSVYPNPVNNYLTIQIHQAVDADLNFGIYDVSGKLVKVQMQKDAKIGVNKYYVPMEDLSTGVYLLKINTGDYSQTLKFIKN
ncbi:MAG: alkaline phosphatase D family protein [Bacteroidota bacterium]|nr:alkaline phosphatase D family protein [Bacteroidota bacterium]